MTEPRDTNELAALLDGRLTGRDRERALARLAARDDDAEVFADAAAVLRELEAEEAEHAGPGTPVTPLRPRAPAWRRPPTRWVALAAVLAGVLLTPYALSRSGSRGGPGDFAALLAARDAGLPAGWTDYRPWRVTRGPGDPVLDNGRAARLGALHVDLRLAVAARQAEQTEILCRQIEALLIATTAGSVAAEPCREIAGRAGEPAAALLPLVRESEESVAAYLGDGAYFTLGAWTEAALLAARAAEAEFFAARRSRAALGRAAASPELTPATREALERVRARLAAGGEPDWPALRRELEALLAATHR